MDKQSINLDLKKAIQVGILNIDGVRTQLEMLNRIEILDAHKYNKWQGKDGIWYTYVYDPTRKEKRRRIKRKTEECLDDAIIEEYSEEVKNKLTLTDIYPEWLAYLSLHTTKTSNVKRYTSEWTKYYASTAIATKPLDELDKLTLDEWVHKMIKANKMSKKQYYTMSYVIRHCMEYAELKGYIDKDIFQGIKVDKKMFRKVKKKADETQVYLEDEQPLILGKAWEDYYSNPMDTASLAVILQFYLGTRPGELVAIKEEDIVNDYVYIQHMEIGVFEEVGCGEYKKVGREVVEHTKSDAGDREVYLVPEARAVIELIKAVNERRGCSGEYLFMRDGERINESAVTWKLKKYCNHLGIQFKSLHKVRKTVISTMIDANININTIRKFVGHEDEKTTYKCYCFDRKRPSEINKQIEHALGGNEDICKLIPFKKSQNDYDYQGTRGHQIQAV